MDHISKLWNETMLVASREIYQKKLSYPRKHGLYILFSYGTIIICSLLMKNLESTILISNGVLVNYWCDGGGKGCVPIRNSNAQVSSRLRRRVMKNGDSYLNWCGSVFIHWAKQHGST